MNDIIDEPTPTQEVWKDKESSLQQKHDEAVMDLYFAVYHEDKTAIDAAIVRIKAIEATQKLVHAAARKHVLSKARQKSAQARAHL